MNGYFRLQINTGNTGIIIYPPTEGGTPVDVSEIMQYLTVKQITYDAKEIGKTMAELKEPTEVLINLDTRFPEQEIFFTRISQDRMTVVARFYPPSNGGYLLNDTEIISTLNYQKIVYGIDTQAIRNFITKREYCTDFVIARGKAPIQGCDARIEYYFETNPRIKPTLLEDGSVDFFHLNTLVQCQKGQILARLYPAQMGEAGYAVHGDIIKPREVKRASLKYGKNILIDDQKTVLTSDVDGHVTLVNDMVCVSDVYEVTNVDNTSGDIEYEGSVKIKGNITTNFNVKAKGNILIDGVVEGARVEAGGDIIIARGMNGMNKGQLIAGGNVISKFLENCTVKAGGYVETESILHCNIASKNEVILTGRKAFITGGRVSATNKVSLKTLGSPLGADTIVEVGADPCVKEEYQKKQKEVVEIQKNLKKIEPVLVAMTQKIQSGMKLLPEQVKYVQTLGETVKILKNNLEEDKKRMDELQKVLEESTSASIVVTGEVYPGTKIVITDAGMTVKETIQHCKFIKSQGEVLMTSI